MNEHRAYSDASNRQDDPFMEERIREMERMRREQQGNSNWRSEPFSPYSHISEPPYMSEKPPRKSKWVSVLLAAIFPGLGHFYLGLMQRGLLMMMLLALNIVSIVYFTSNVGTNVPLIVLLALLLPVIYFFNLFDTMQHTEKVNLQAMYGTPMVINQGPWLGIFLVIAGLMLLIFAIDPSWLRWVFHDYGSFIGAGFLIMGGIYLLYKESRKRS